MNLGNTNIPFYDVLGLVENMGETWKQSMSSVRVDFSECYNDIIDYYLLPTFIYFELFYC